MSEPQQQPSFGIEKVYVKDLSLEIPHAPGVFLSGEQPQIEVQLHHEGNAVGEGNAAGEGIYQVVLTVTVTAKAGEKVLFLVEAAQAGIFRLRNVPEADLEPLLATVCPNILFPYVRETVTDVVVRAGFPPVYLTPVNFDALYMQRRQQAQDQAAPKIEIAH